MKKNSMDIPVECFSAECPSRELFEQISDKWSMMVLITIEKGPERFSIIKRRLEGVTQKALTQSLRKLERNGMVTRHVISASPIAVVYEITSLGLTLLVPLKVLHEWTIDKLQEVKAARSKFDQHDTLEKCGLPT